MHDLVVSPNPVTLEGRRIVQGAELQPGETLAAFLTRHGVDLSRGDWVLTVGGAQIPRLMWDRTRPRHGHLIECRRAAGKQVIMLVAIVFIAWVTMGAGLAAMGVGAQAGMSAAAIAGTGVSGIAGALGMSAGFAALAVNAGAMMLGSMLIQKLLPPAKVRMPSYDQATASQTYSIGGGRNTARPFEPLPLLFGIVRVVPDYATQPFQAFEGDDQYQYVRLYGGINCGKVEDLRIGDTPITTYQDLEVSRSGFPGSTEKLTEWSNVDTIAGGTLDAEGSAPGPWVVRSSSANSVRLAIDIGGSLYKMGDDGSFELATMRYEAQRRLLPDGVWEAFVNGDSEIQLSSMATKPIRQTWKTEELPAGQYEVRLRKLTLNVHSSREANSLEWGSLKSYQLDNSDYAKHPHVGLRVRASGQISGALDAVNWIATAAATPVWTGSAWETQETRNPGAQILQFGRGLYDADGALMAGLGLPDSQIDIEELKLFMLHCAEKGMTFDHWFDGQVSCGDVLDAMASAGMGSISYHTGKLSVIWVRSDQPKEAVVVMPNIKKGSFRIDYATRELAEELELSWPDRDSNWRQRSVRVKAPGVGTPRDTARLAPIGITTEVGALRAARFTMAQNIYQRKSVTWEMDMEHLNFRRFSLIALSHDLTKWGSGGRLLGVNTNAGAVTLLLDDEVKPVATATAWFVGLRLPGDTSYRVFQIAPITAATRVLTLAEPWPAGVPLPGATADDQVHDTLWISDFKAQPGQLLRVSSIEPGSGLTGARITAVPEGPEFWNYVDTGTYVATPAPPPTEAVAVKNVVVTQDRLELNYDARAQLTVTFDVSGPYDHAQIWAAPTGQVPEFIGSTKTRRFSDWTVDTTGQFSVEVRPFNALGRPGVVASGMTTVTLGPVVQTVLDVQYSADTLSWHAVFSAGDVYMRQRVGVGAWSAAIRIVGEAGADGVDAMFIDYVFKRSPAAPETPMGNGTPAGWSDSPPAGTDPIWMSKATKTAEDVLVGLWSAPARLTGENGAPGVDGKDGTNGLNTAVVYIYKRSAAAPALPTAVATYNFSTATLIGLNGGWSAAPPAGSDPLYLAVGTASAAGASDAIAPNEWAEPVVVGSTGLNSATVYLFQRTATAAAPALPSATVTYTFATAAAAGVNNGWSQTLPTAGGAYRWVTTASALSSGATDTIAAGEWAAVSLLSQDGAQGPQGPQGQPGQAGAPGASVRWIKSTGCNYNAQLAGFVGYAATASNGAIQETSHLGHNLSIFNPLTDSFEGGLQSFNTYSDGTAGLISALAAVPAGKLIVIFSADASSVDGALRTALGNFGSSDPTLWTASRVSHVFIGQRGLKPGGAYEAISAASDASGVISVQAYFTSTGLVSNGATAVAAVLSNEAVVFPADSTGAVTSYSGNSTTISMLIGGADDSANWTFSKVDSAGVSSTRNGRTVTIDGISAGTDSGYVDITAGRAGFAQVTKRFSISKSKSGLNGAAGGQGQRGSIEASRTIGSASWSASEAAQAIASAGYGAPVVLDRVTLQNPSAGYVESRYFDGGNWLTWSALVNGNLLVNGSVGAQKLSVNQLSAISAVIGLLRSATSGGRLEYATQLISAYDDTNAVRIELGYAP